MKEKLATKMDYDEFLGWAITLVVERFLEDGLKGIRSSVDTVVYHAMMNEVFGGKKK
jgi:hypothetical protein